MLRSQLLEAPWRSDDHIQQAHRDRQGRCSPSLARRWSTKLPSKSTTSSSSRAASRILRASSKSPFHLLRWCTSEEEEQRLISHLVSPIISVPRRLITHSSSPSADPDMNVFFDDLAAVYRAELAALYASGCRYVQLDDTNLAYLCSDEQRALAESRGEVSVQSGDLWAEMLTDIRVLGRQGAPEEVRRAYQQLLGGQRRRHDGRYPPLSVRISLSYLCWPALTTRVEETSDRDTSVVEGMNPLRKSSSRNSMSTSTSSSTTTPGDFLLPSIPSVLTRRRTDPEDSNLFDTYPKEIRSSLSDSSVPRRAFWRRKKTSSRASGKQRRSVPSSSSTSDLSAGSRVRCMGTN
jgi:hypothetical protein